MRGGPGRHGKSDKIGVAMIAAGLALAVLAVIPVRLILILAGAALIVLGTLMASKCAGK